MLHHFMYASFQSDNHETVMQKKEYTHDILTSVEFQRKLNPKINDCGVNPVNFDYEVVSTSYNGNGKLRTKAKML